MNRIEYHPDPEINAQVARDTLAAEVADLNAGFPPRRWICPCCHAAHSRGHFMSVGVHRCLRCGYVGEGGVMVDEREAA
jgi:ribosomal protein L37AE/L43A